MDSLKSLTYTSILLSIHTAYTISSLVDRVRIRPEPSAYLPLSPGESTEASTATVGVGAEPQHVALCIVLDKATKYMIEAESTSGTPAASRSRKGKERADARTTKGPNGDVDRQLEDLTLACVLDAVRWAQERGIQELSVWQENGLLDLILPRIMHISTSRPLSPPTSVPSPAFSPGASSSSSRSSSSTAHVGREDLCYRGIRSREEATRNEALGRSTRGNDAAHGRAKERDVKHPEWLDVIAISNDMTSSDAKDSSLGGGRNDHFQDGEEEQEALAGPGGTMTGVHTMTIWPDLDELVLGRERESYQPSRPIRPLLLHILPHAPGSSALLGVARKLAYAERKSRRRGKATIEIRDRELSIRPAREKGDVIRDMAAKGPENQPGSLESEGTAEGMDEASMVPGRPSGSTITDAEAVLGQDDLVEDERDEGADIEQAELDRLIREEMHFEQEPSLLILHTLRPPSTNPPPSSSPLTSVIASGPTTPSTLSAFSNGFASLLRRILPQAPPELHSFPAWPLRITEIYQPPPGKIYIIRLGLSVYDRLFRRVTVTSSTPSRRPKHLLTGPDRDLDIDESTSNGERNGKELESTSLRYLERREEWDRAVWRWAGVEQRLGR